MYRQARWWMLGLLVVIVVGFWPSYYSKLFSGELTLPLHLHGATMTLWCVLLLSQVLLITSGKSRLHRRLGRSSIPLAIAIVVTSLHVNQVKAARDYAKNPELVLALYWAGIAMMAIFAGLYVTALRHRRNMQIHARCMLATGLVFVAAALARALYWIPTELGIEPPDSLVLSLIIPALVAVGAVVHEWRRGKVYPVFVWFTGLWVVFVIAGFLWIAEVDFWRSFTEWAIGH